MVMLSAPALANSAIWRSGCSIMRWTSTSAPAAWTCSAIAPTASGPIVIGGTKWPSITSTWMTPAPAASTSPTSSPSRAKSAARIDGATPASSPAIRSPGASSSRSGCTGTAPCRTSARSSSAPRSSGTRRPARTGSGSSHSGTYPEGWSDVATARDTTGRAGRGRPPDRSRGLAPAQPGDEEPLRAVAMGQRLEVSGHTRMLPDRQLLAQVVRLEVGVLGEKPGHDALVLARGDRARGVHERPAGAQRGGARAQDRGLGAREPLGLVGGLAPARVGAAGERAEIRARRIDQHAVVGAGLLLGGGVGRADLDAAGAHALGGASQRRGAPRVALDGDDRAAVLDQRGEMGGLAARRRAEVEDALARPRREQARDRHRRARLRHEQPLAPFRAAVGVEGLLEHEAL